MVEFLENLIQTYGYLALFLGTFAEGETVLVLGGIAAHLGHLTLGWVMVAAFFGSLLGDQTVFLIGRLWGRSFLARRPWLQPRVEKVQRLLERHHVLILLSFRFFYGLRNLIPIVVGTTRIRVARFVLFNTIGAAVWAVTVATGGYLLGAAMETLLGKMKIVTLGLVAAVGLAVWIVYRLRQRRARHESEPAAR